MFQHRVGTLCEEKTEMLTSVSSVYYTARPKYDNTLTMRQFDRIPSGSDKANYSYFGVTSPGTSKKSI